MYELSCKFAYFCIAVFILCCLAACAHAHRCCSSGSNVQNQIVFNGHWFSFQAIDDCWLIDHKFYERDTSTLDVKVGGDYTTAIRDSLLMTKLRDSNEYFVVRATENVGELGLPYETPLFSKMAKSARHSRYKDWDVYMWSHPKDNALRWEFMKQCDGWYFRGASTYSYELQDIQKIIDAVGFKK